MSTPIKLFASRAELHNLQSKMRRFMIRHLARAVLALFVLTAVSAASSASLADSKPAAVPVVSKPVGVLLDAARKQLLSGDNAGAKVTVMQAQALPDRTPIDNYEIQNFLGNIAIKLNDHAAALAAYEAMADSPSIPDAEKASTFRIATLLATEAKQFDKGILYGNKFIALGGAPDDSVLSAIAEDFFYKNDYANAELFGKQAIASPLEGKAPNQGALEAVFASQLKLKKDADALSTLETMVTFYNDPESWGQLIDVALGTKGIKDVEALDLYRLRLASKAPAQGEDYSLMAALALTNGYPVEAQSILEAGIAAGKLTNSGKTAAQLAEARSRAAKDRASLVAFEAAALKSSSGELDVKLAENYYGYGRYADAVTAARRGLNKGGSKTDANEANMVIGMASVMQNGNTDALAAFNNVKSGSPALMKAAHLWNVFAGRKYAATSP
jgi:hypothetical protein